MKKMLAFVHIEKTAGTSMIHMLRDSFSPRYIDVRPVTNSGYWFSARDLLWYSKVMPWVNVIGGHSVVPFSDLDDYFDVKYFALFREPIARYISQFQYWRSKLGKEITFDDFLTRSGAWNLQTNKISSDGIASTAIETLQEKFVAYGISEDINSFLTVFGNYINKDLLVFRKNTGKNKEKSAEEIKDKYLQAIIDRNEQDIILYNWVRNYSEQVSSINNIKEQLANTPRMLFDYTYRKSFCEPVSGAKRLLNGMPYFGSYGIR